MQKTETDILICETLDDYMASIEDWSHSKKKEYPETNRLFNRYQILVAVADIEKENE